MISQGSRAEEQVGATPPATPMLRPSALIATTKLRETWIF
jgi:hypothetical protein